jgi:hypothetical protein
MTVRRKNIRGQQKPLDLMQHSSSVVAAAQDLDAREMSLLRETLNWRKFPYRKNGNQFERCESAYCQIAYSLSTWSW